MMPWKETYDPFWDYHYISTLRVKTTDPVIRKYFGQEENEPIVIFTEGSEPRSRLRSALINAILREEDSKISQHYLPLSWVVA